MVTSSAASVPTSPATPVSPVVAATGAAAGPGLARSKSALVSQFERAGAPVMGMGGPPPGALKALAAKRASVEAGAKADDAASAAPATEVDELGMRVPHTHA
jgi:hypothetical protein